MIDFKGKRALVFGVASEESIAWAISQWIIKAGGAVTLVYQKRFRSRVWQLVKDVQGIEDKLECDITVEQEVQDVYSKLNGKFDMVVHGVAFAPAEALANPITQTTEEDFNKALVTSSYSLKRITHHSLECLNEGGTILTLSYLGAIRVVPGYRVMGVAKAALEALVRELSDEIGARGLRINAISSGPIKTLAAGGVPGFDNILSFIKNASPLKRNIVQDDVAKAAIFLLSDMSSGITGQTIYVDGGYSIVGVPPFE